MTKFTNDLALDAGLEFIADSATKIVVLSAYPATYAEANTTYDGTASKYKLAEVAVTAGAGAGDFTLGNGDVSGRKLSVVSQTGLTVLATANATHIAILDATNSRVLNVTECTSQAVALGGTVDVTGWDIELQDPSA